MDKNAKVAFFGAAHDGLAGLAYGAGMPVQGGARPSRFWQISYPNSTRGGGYRLCLPPPQIFRPSDIPGDGLEYLPVLNQVLLGVSRHHRIM